MDKQRQRQLRTARTATATARGGKASMPTNSITDGEVRQSKSPFKAKLNDLGVKRGALAAAKVGYEAALKRFKATSPMDGEFERITNELQVATEMYVRAGESMARCCENA